MAKDQPIDNSSYEERKRIIEQTRILEEESSRSFSSMLNSMKNFVKLQKANKGLAQDISHYQEELKKAKNGDIKLSKEQQKILEQKLKNGEQSLKISEASLKNMSKTKVALTALANEAARFGDNLNVYDFLMESDKAIRTLNADLGVSGSLAATMRDNIQGAAVQAARYGVSVKDLTEVQAGFTELTGKLAPLTEDAFKGTSQMSKALNMSATDTGILVGNFNTIGLSAEATRNFVEETLQKSESMGVSGTKTIKTLTANFDKLNKYNFQGGVRSFAELVKSSIAIKQNLENVFNAADRFRTLEGSIEAAATLQTLGGAMGNADPFKLGFLSRNDPEKFAQELHKMTEGVYTFDKATNTFKSSAVGLDRLRQLAEATGQDFNTLSAESRRFAETQLISSKTIGLSKDDKLLVSQLAQFNDKTKKFEVQIDGKNIDISKLGTDQLQLLKNQQKSLEDRAKDTQNFDDAFKNTIMQLKSALLPVLNLINKGLTWINSTGDDWLSITGRLVAFGSSMLLLKGISSNLGTFATNMVKMPFAGGGGGSIASTAASTIPAGAGKAAGDLGGGLSKIPDGASLTSKAKGIAAIGIAAVGIGAGIFLAATGVAKLSDSFSKLDEKQMSGVLKTLGLITASFVVLGGLGSIVGAPLLVVGTAIGIIGAGIGLAAYGVSTLVTSIGSLSDPSLGSNVGSLALGIGGLSLATASLANPLSLVGLGAMSAFLNSIDNGLDFSKMNEAFIHANNFLTASPKNLELLRDTINMLSNSDIKGITELKNVIGELTKKPLQVEFSNKEVNLNVNVTAELDGDKVSKSLQISKRMTIEMVNFKRGV